MSLQHMNEALLTRILSNDRQFVFIKTVDRFLLSSSA